MPMDMLANPVWIVQIRGITIIVKLALLLLLGLHPGWDKALLMMMIIMSAVISHAPGKVRYHLVAGGDRIKGTDSMG